MPMQLLRLFFLFCICLHVQHAHARLTVESSVSFHLENGNTIRLAGLLPLEYVSLPHAKRAESALQALLQTAEEPLLKEQTTNRHGQTVAQIHTQDGVWIQTYLLEKGLAILYDTPAEEPTATMLQQAEKIAREKQRGIWKLNHLSVTPEELKSRKLYGNAPFVVLTGEIKRVKRASQFTYLDMGEDWKTDPAIAIPKHVLYRFKKAGIDVKALEGKSVEAHGWVTYYLSVPPCTAVSSHKSLFH